MTRLERFLANPPRRISEDAVRVRRTKALRRQLKRITTLKQLRKEQGNRCYFCKRLMLQRASVPEEREYVATLEHLTALAKGGDNSRENLAATCHRCNTEKGDMDEEEYAAVWRARHAEQRRILNALKPPRSSTTL